MKKIYQRVDENNVIFFNGSIYHYPKYKFNPSTMEIDLNDNEKRLNSVEQDVNGNYISLVCRLGDGLNVEIPEDLFIVHS